MPSDNNQRDRDQEEHESDDVSDTCCEYSAETFSSLMFLPPRRGFEFLLF